jgi:hypothetical protein
MLVQELPEEERHQLRALLEAAGERWDRVEGFTLEELQQWFGAREDDLKAKLERTQRRLAVETELSELADLVTDKVGDIPMGKIEYFLHGAERERFQELMRELGEMSEVPLVTRNRQPWHDASEQELNRALNRKGGCTIDDVVKAVLARDSAYPAGSVREYVTYILETSAGLR